MRPSIYRRATIDVMRIARQVPMVPAQRRMQLGPLIEARKAAGLSWSAIFTKAYALTAREMPMLRRGYFRYPVPRFVDFPVSAAAIAVERDLDGESVVCPLIVPDPASLSLRELSQRIDHAKIARVEDAAEFARIRRIVGLPWPIRPLALWLGYVIPSARFDYYGTFGVTTVVADGAELLNLVSPLPMVLSYSPIRNGGEIDVRIMFDHRIVDAVPVARALVRLEQVLTGPIADEIASPLPLAGGKERARSRRRRRT